MPSLAGKAYCRYPHGHHLRASSQRQGRGSGTEQPECEDVGFSDYFYLRCFDRPTMRVVRRFRSMARKSNLRLRARGPWMAPNYFDSMNRLAGELFGTRPGQPAEGGAERGGGTRPRPRRSWRPGADPSRYERADRRPADARRVRPNAGVSRTRAEALAHRRGGRFGFGRETVTHRWKREDAPTRATRLGALASATNELRSRAELAAGRSRGGRGRS